MDEKQQYTIDIIQAMAERTIVRLWVIIIILIVLLAGTNAAWIYYESQWEVVENTTIEAEQSTEGGNNYAVGGDMIGTPESENN